MHSHNRGLETVAEVCWAEIIGFGKIVEKKGIPAKLRSRTAELQRQQNAEKDEFWLQVDRKFVVIC